MAIEYSDIAEHVDAGKTPAEIETILAADLRTVRSFSADGLLDILINDLNVLRVRSNGAFNGKLVAAVANSQNADLKDGFDRFLANIQIRDASRVVIQSDTDPQVAALVAGITQIAVTDDPANAAMIVATLDVLHGGRKCAGVTAATIQTLIDNFNLSQDVSDAMNQHVNPILSGTDRAAIVAGLRAAADAIEAG